MMFPAILVLFALAYSSYAVPINLGTSKAQYWSTDWKWPSYTTAEEKVLEKVAAQTSKLILDSMLKKGETIDEAAKVREQFLGNLFDNTIPSPFTEIEKKVEQQDLDLNKLADLFKNAMNLSEKRQNADAIQARNQFFNLPSIPSPFKEIEEAEEQQDLDLSKLTEFLKNAMNPSDKRQNADAIQARNQFFNLPSIPSPFKEIEEAEEQQDFDLSKLTEFLKNAMNPSDKRQNADAIQARNQIFNLPNTLFDALQVPN